MANSVLTTDRTPALNFADISGALDYWAQISADPRFSSITHQQTALASSTWTPTSNLTDAKKYYWRFRARTSASYTSDATNATGGGSGNALRDAAARTYLGQSFVPLRSLPIARVTLSLKKTGSPTGNIWAEIWTTSGGTPSAISGTASANVDVSTLAGSFGDINFDFATPVPVASGTTYAIILRGDNTINGSDYAEWQHDGAGSYSSGAPFKADGTPSWSANGSSDHIFTSKVQGWASWSPIWSFWVDSTAEAAVTPTAWTLVDPDETTDSYTFDVAPQYRDPDEDHVRRGYDRNIQGDLLTEYISTRARLSLIFDPAYIKWDQVAEIMRFYHKRKAVYLIMLTDYVQDNRERIYKVEFAETPSFEPVANGREDYFRGSVELEEAALT